MRVASVLTQSMRDEARRTLVQHSMILFVPRLLLSDDPFELAFEVLLDVATQLDLRSVAHLGDWLISWVDALREEVWNSSQGECARRCSKRRSMCSTWRFPGRPS